MREEARVNTSKYITLGLLVAMRSMTLPAVVTDHLSQKKKRKYRDLADELLHDPQVATFAKMAAGGEMLFDKTEFVPARIGFIPLAGRMGVAASLALAVADEEERARAAVVAALAAGYGSFLAYFLRKRIRKRLKIADTPVALAEDALVTRGALWWRDTYLK